VVSGASRQMAATSEEAGRETGEVARTVGEVASGAERQVVMIEAARRPASPARHAGSYLSRSTPVFVCVQSVSRRGSGRGVERNSRLPVPSTSGWMNTL
jgi:methyl-accepting chemotaxis protein